MNPMSTLIRHVVVIVVVCVLCALGGVERAMADAVVEPPCGETELDAALEVGGTITFNCGAGPVTITTEATKVITSNTTIDGAGGRITLKGAGGVGLFFVGAEELTLRNLTLANGGGPIGGAVLIERGASLHVRQCTLTGNTAAVLGGAVANLGTAEISNSTFTGNSAGGGAAMANGPDATLTLFNTTVAGNADLVGGGAIFNDGGEVTLINSIIANTYDGDGNSTETNCFGAPVTDGGHNLQFPGTSCGESIPETDPLLGPLTENGGPTPTMALGPDSPAINMGDSAVCAAAPVNAVDQRGVDRPALCDIGAFEFEQEADTDGDGVPDDEDRCPDTPEGAVVDVAGCSIDQLCPCNEVPWRNHGAYVSCVSHAAERFLAAALITEEEKDAVVSAAARSKCGSTKRR